MKLTDSAYWDSYWMNVTVPSRIDLDFSFERCLDKVFSRYLPVSPAKSLIEIGCAPGRWLIYFHERYQYQVSGIENSAIGFQRTKENLEYHGIKGEIHNTDVMEGGLPGSYDVVISLGLIEHFTDTRAVLETHLSLVKPGGLLILGVPNFRGINYCIQRYMYAELFATHNTTIMNKAFFTDLAKRSALETVFLDYLGGFEPALFIYEPRGRQFVRACLKMARLLRRLEWADTINAPWLSSYLMGIFRARKSQV